jgi:hypothetical protein
MSIAVLAPNVPEKTITTEPELADFMAANLNVTLNTESGNWEIEDINGLLLAHSSNDRKL